MRVLHIPARTPYARKLVPDGVSIVNETQSSGVEIPRDASFQWLASQSSYDFFDLLHIHSVELTPLETLHMALERCKRDKKGIVLTVHDTKPVFSQDSVAHNIALKMCVEAGAQTSTLTKGAQKEIESDLGIASSNITVIPHGAVLPVDDHKWHLGRQSNDSLTCIFGMYGGFRPNRDLLTPSVNIAFGLPELDAKLVILTRAISPIEVRQNEEMRMLIQLANSSKRIDLRIFPFPSDNQIAEFLLGVDILIMPYRWGTHSGQLELAFDLGVVPVISDVGYYCDQYEELKEIVEQPVWFNWSDGNEFAYGARLLDAIGKGWEKMQHMQSLYSREMLHQHRIIEHHGILSSYGRLYQLAVHVFT